MAHSNTESPLADWEVVGTSGEQISKVCQSNCCGGKDLCSARVSGIFRIFRFVPNVAFAPCFRVLVHQDWRNFNFKFRYSHGLGPSAYAQANLAKPYRGLLQVAQLSQPETMAVQNPSEQGCRPGSWCWWAVVAACGSAQAWTAGWMLL